MKIVYIAQFNDACGYASASRKLLRSFKKFGFSNEELKIYPINFEKQRIN